MPAAWIARPVVFLRHIAWIEGISFLVLLGVGMPLKYFAGMPMAVKVLGWIHGVLFVLFCLGLFRVWTRAKWPESRCALVFIAGLIPFGPFFVDRRIDEWEKQDASLV